MKYEIEPSKIIKHQYLKRDAEYILSPYVVEHFYDNKILLSNVMTDELLAYDSEDEILQDRLYLTSKWFYINKDIDPKSFCDGLLLDMGISEDYYREKMTVPSKYSIFTTLSCNARCYYCYQCAKSDNSMSADTALNLAKYIVNHWDGKSRIELAWFGGEPLVNSTVIDIVTDYLYEHNIYFISTMTTNGYLIDKFNPYILKHKWNLRGLQITLDGDTDDYKEIKNYKNSDSDPLEHVLKNIDYLSSLGIRVSLRSNVSPYNIDGLYSLIDKLSDRYKNKDVNLYFNPLFESLGDPPIIYNEEDRKKMTEGVISLTNYGIDKGICHKKIYTSMTTVYHCMADDPDYACISPNGKFCVCEHYYDDEYTVGDVRTNYDNLSFKHDWKSTGRSYDYCKRCFRYPVCRNSEQCPTENYVCDKYYSEMHLNNYKHQLEFIYDEWKLGDLC